MISRPLRWTPAALLVLASACGTVTTSGTAVGPRSQSSFVPTSELRTEYVANAHEYLQRLRPHWLHARGDAGPYGTGVAVYMDGLYLGGLQSLRDVPRTWVASFERISGPEAARRFGTAKGGSAIVITSPRGDTALR